MIKGINSKQRRESGETLVEALVAVLISSLAMLLLAMAIQVAVHLIMQGQTMSSNYYDAINQVASNAEATDASHKVKIAVAINDDLKTDGEIAFEEDPYVVYTDVDNVPGVNEDMVVAYEYAGS